MYINVTSEVDFYGTLKKIYTRSKIYGTLFSFSRWDIKMWLFFLRVIDRSLLETETKRKAMNFFSSTIEGIISVVNPFINESN